MAANVYDGTVAVLMSLENRDARRADCITEWALLGAYKDMETGLNDLQFAYYSEIGELVANGGKVIDTRYTDEDGDYWIPVNHKYIRGIEMMCCDADGEPFYKTFVLHTVECIK